MEGHCIFKAVFLHKAPALPVLVSGADHIQMHRNSHVLEILRESKRELGVLEIQKASGPGDFNCFAVLRVVFDLFELSRRIPAQLREISPAQHLPRKRVNQ